ncbi:MAG: ABC transporter substrate-binding protein [Acidobacteriota bacterium]|nr:ABC transporter substrate-binding protein [Acidobacteriota bacterium]MDE3092724.1 ABC transporter substrate-binding protein [Acidobacteriota bacterium]MDE3146993.1 ABC transporter substrate-binding protein [Acidobacteriota bacterium]
MRIRLAGALALSAALVSVGFTVASGSSGAAPLKSVTFAYDFPGPDFELIPVVVAQKEGYFAKAGLNVTVKFPPNTSTTSLMLSTGAANVGFVTTTDMGVAVDKKVPLLAIANYSMSNNWALFAKPGVKLDAAHLKSQLKGKRIFSYGDTWTEAMLPFVLRHAGLTASQVKIVTDPTAIDLNYLLAGKVDVSTSTTNYEIPGFEGAKVKGTLTQLLGTAVGAPNIPIWDYATTKSYAASNGANLKAFMSAIAQATKWAVANPTKAASLFDTTYPQSGYTNAYNLSGWKLTIPYLRNAQGKYFVETTAQWATLSSALKSIGLIAKVPAPSSYFTNKFLPAS